MPRQVLLLLAMVVRLLVQWRPLVRWVKAPGKAVVAGAGIGCALAPLP